MVRPVDSDHVDFVITAAQEHNPLDGAASVCDNRSRRRSVRRRSRNDRASSLNVARRDLTHDLGRARLTLRELVTCPGVRVPAVPTPEPLLRLR
jgi:hypothetical protein